MIFLVIFTVISISSQMAIIYFHDHLMIIPNYNNVSQPMNSNGEIKGQFST